MGCKNSKDFESDFEKHKFVPIIINKLPEYDSLQKMILNNLGDFNLHDTIYHFTYIYNFNPKTSISGYNNDGVPANIYPAIVPLFERIGKENIFGFVISRDSTLEILVRNTHLKKYFLDVRERLLLSPNAENFRQKTFPFKDTLFNNRWKYQVW